MGKREIKRLDHRWDRLTAYSKRSRGLLKKAYEIAVLCNVDAALITYSPTDTLRHFSTAPNIEKVLQRFVQHLPDMPEDERRKFQVSEETINRINFATAGQEGPFVAEEEESNKEIINQYRNKLMLLQEQERMLNPGKGTLNSMAAFEERNRCLEIYLKKIIEREIQLKMLQQQQAVAESSYWGPPQGGQQLQQQGIPAVETGNSPSSSVQPQPHPLLDASPLFPRDFKTSMPNPVIPEVAGPSGTSDFHRQLPMQQPQPFGQTSDNMQQVPVPLHLGDEKQEMPYRRGVFGSVQQRTISQPPVSSGNQSEYDALWAPYLNEELCSIGPI